MKYMYFWLLIIFGLFWNKIMKIYINDDDTILDEQLIINNIMLFVNETTCMAHC